MDAITIGSGFRFEGFCLGPYGDLRRENGATVQLGSRALAVLRVLVEREGQLVPKQAIMDAVWPGLAVEEGNLTVQVSALRKALDADHAGPSCIHTVPGRGYRFVWTVTRIADPGEAATPACVTQAETEPAPPEAAAEPGRRRSRWPLLAAIVAVLCAAILATMQHRAGPAASPFPRLSLVVLPFQNAGSDKEDDYLADAVTDDLTSDLSHILSAKVIARSSTRPYKGKSVDVRQVGRDLDVRYVVHGSVRRVGSVLRVNAELASAETGAQVWSDRFDEDVNDLGAGQRDIVVRIKGALKIKLLDHESARSARERPTDPDAFDLVLRARSLWYNQPFGRRRNTEAATLFERALRLDPSSVPAMLGLAEVLLEQLTDRQGEADNLRRAQALVAQASTIDPNGEAVLNTKAFLLRTQGRWDELAHLTRAQIDAYPNNVVGYHQLANALLYGGKAEEAIAPLQTALLLDPRDPNIFLRYLKMAWAMTLLGRDAEAVVWAQRSIAAHPTNEPDQQVHLYLMIAAAEAWSGHAAEAQTALTAANRVWPFATVRSHAPSNPSSSLLLAQLRRYQEGLRRAGLRDHADEDADVGVPPQADLQSRWGGQTPTTAPGSSTIRTQDLAAMLARQKPVILDTVNYHWGPSLPGAVGLRGAGLGGSFSDEAQGRLQRKLHQLTSGDLSRPIVVAGWNAERFDGYNLALRLAALGYRQVLWYRGGREAWEAAGMPETELALQDW